MENWRNRTYERKWINEGGAKERRKKACSAPRIFYLSSSQLSSLLSLTARINPGQVVKEFPPTEPGPRPPAADSSAIYSPLYFLPRVFTFTWKSWLVGKKGKKIYHSPVPSKFPRTIDLIIELSNGYLNFSPLSLHLFRSSETKSSTCAERSLAVSQTAWFLRRL